MDMYSRLAGNMGGLFGALVEDALLGVSGRNMRSTKRSESCGFAWQVQSFKLLRFQDAFMYGMEDLVSIPLHQRLSDGAFLIYVPYSSGHRAILS